MKTRKKKKITNRYEKQTHKNTTYILHILFAIKNQQILPSQSQGPHELRNGFKSLYIVARILTKTLCSIKLGN